MLMLTKFHSGFASVIELHLQEGFFCFKILHARTREHQSHAAAYENAEPCARDKQEPWMSKEKLHESSHLSYFSETSTFVKDGAGRQRVANHFSPLNKREVLA
ncbi:hypothetical protein [Acidobacterium sp. S8]|uniref:hypothetical protein n=1 Tax=Acidobacterium sp. S8 TaxID=1641854 RepID=UPI00131B093B|nr:hypothetical protein [Acidobacterium sp. S8]